MSDLKLGKIIEGECGRDAIHIAVAPMVAAESLRPGAHVGPLPGMTGLAGHVPTPVGIVDPFLTDVVEKGDRFWLFLYPNTITSLRHEWTHPAFASSLPSPESPSRRWIEDFAMELDQTYHRLMEAAAQWVRIGEYTYDNTEAYKDVDYSKWPTFWEHYEIVTGKKVEDHDATIFTCSC